MAASRMLGATVFTAVPAFLMIRCGKVKAETMKIHPRELDIYAEPAATVVLEEDGDEENVSALERHVSVVRMKIWEISDSFKDTKLSITNSAKSGQSKVLEFVNLITTDQTFQMKVGVITGATLAGAVLAGRGRRPFRRVLFGSTLGVAAASICYPTVAVDTTLKGYETIKEAAVKQWEAYKSKAPGPIPEKSEELSSETKESEIAVSLDPAEIMDDSAVEIQATQSEVKVSTEADKVVEEVKVLETPSERKPFLESVPFYDKIMKKISPAKSSPEKTESEIELLVPELDTKETTPETPSLTPEVVGDPGMSEAEDKDMYSTRS